MGQKWGGAAKQESQKGTKNKEIPRCLSMHKDFPTNKRGGGRKTQDHGEGWSRPKKAGNQQTDLKG